MSDRTPPTHCVGNHVCPASQVCCTAGCCTVFMQSVFNPLFLGHWYFWLAVTATVAGILCACSLWRKHSQNICWCCKRGGGRDERASEPDSNGSCYAPPQYSRCNSFHQAPPPYSEVTSKPDLYPLVISYNGDPVIKSNNSSTGYLMVQYFRNFIVRPGGSLSATSTIDSLSSSFICNAANEANTIIPPPYSCTGSLEEVTCDTNNTQQPSQNLQRTQRMPRSASQISSTSYHQVQVVSRSPSQQSYIAGATVPPTPQNFTQKQQNLPPVVSIRDNPCFEGNTSNIGVKTSSIDSGSTTVPNEVEIIERSKVESQSQTTNCDASTTLRLSKKLSSLHKLQSQHRSQDSESQDEEHNFSELLNLSVCVPNSVVPLDTPTLTGPHQQDHRFSVANSMTGSDISSLANLGTPDSPPRATSPTVEMKELLDKIQQLPQQKSPLPPQQQQENRSSKGYFHRAKAKTMYMPLYEGPNPNKPKNQLFSRSWLSRSAPNTPCSNFVPNFPISKNRPSGSQKGSKGKISDGSPLLKEHDESEDETHKYECY